LVLSALKGEFKYSLVESVMEEEQVSFIRKLYLDSEDIIPTVSNIEEELNNCVHSIRRDVTKRTLDEINSSISSLLDSDDGDKDVRSEEHTSELQSRENLVCRLLLEKKKKK